MQRSRFGLALVVAMGLGTACGGDDKTPGPGTAGMGGTAMAGASGSGTPGAGGAGGAGGRASGGTGGTASGACQYPKCLADLSNDCLPMGSCTMSQTATGGSNMCYANGVKVLSTFAISGAGATVSQRYVKPNGTTCYTMEVPFSAGQSGFMITWKNGAGAVVATGTADQSGSYSVTCTGGQPVLLSGCSAPSGQMGMQPTPPMPMGMDTSSSCTMGACM